MTNYKINTYDPNPNGGEITNRNWFNANVIAAVEEPKKDSKPGGSKRVFSNIQEAKFHPDYPPVTLNHGKTLQDKVMDSNTHDYGARWTMVTGGAVDEMIGAAEAARLITGPVRSKDEGWTEDNKGFMAEYFGWHGANTEWYQKWNWELYNSSSNRLCLPVKGISFTIRNPSEDNMFASNAATDYNNSGNTRSDQVAIDRMYGLWYYPDAAQYLCIEMTINGNNHAPSIDPALDGTNFFQPYWFARTSQTEKGNIDHFSEKGAVCHVSAWANDKIIEHSFFCGFAVSNIVDHAATSGHPHTYQMGKLSPIPFHIDRSGEFRAVYGGFATDFNNDWVGRSISTES